MALTARHILMCTVHVLYRIRHAITNFFSRIPDVWLRVSTEIGDFLGCLRGLRTQDSKFIWQKLSVHDAESC